MTKINKDYKVGTYLVKKQRPKRDRPICPICSKCFNKNFCNNRKNIKLMNKCTDCNNCKDSDKDGHIILGNHTINHIINKFTT